MTRTVFAPLAALLILASVAIVPTAAADSRGIALPVVRQTVVFDPFQPSGGSGYYLDSGGCFVAATCLAIPAGAWADFAFTANQRFDELEIYLRGIASSGSECPYRLLYTDGNGLPRDVAILSSCPWTPPGESRNGAWNDYFEPSSLVGDYVVRVECRVGACGLIQVHAAKVVLQHEAMITWTEFHWHPDPYVGFIQCVNVWVTGSLWHRPDYVRISWGDGQETVFTDFSTWDWFGGYWEANNVCHIYAPSLTPYQECTSTHDTLNRFSRGCQDIRWND